MRDAPYDPLDSPPGLDEAVEKIRIQLWHGNWQAAMSVLLAHRKQRLVAAKRLTREEALGTALAEIFEDRVANMCEDHEHLYARTLVRLTPFEIRQWAGVGPEVLKQIQRGLGTLGLALNGTEVMDGTDDEG